MRRLWRFIMRTYYLFAESPVWHTCIREIEPTRSGWRRYEAFDVEVCPPKYCKNKECRDTRLNSGLSVGDKVDRWER